MGDRASLAYGENAARTRLSPPEHLRNSAMGRPGSDDVQRHCTAKTSSRRPLPFAWRSVPAII